AAVPPVHRRPVRGILHVPGPADGDGGLSRRTSRPGERGHDRVAERRPDGGPVVGAAPRGRDPAARRRGPPGRRRVQRRVRRRPPGDPVRPRRRGEGRGPGGRHPPRAHRDAERRPGVPRSAGGRDPGTSGRGGLEAMSEQSTEPAGDGRPAYAYYAAFRAVPGLRDGALDHLGLAHEAEVLFKEWDDRVTVRGVYSTVAFRTDADLMTWWVARSPDDVQELLVAFRRTGLGRGLEQTHAFLVRPRPPPVGEHHLAPSPPA